MSLTAVTFTEEEKEQLRKFANHSYLLDKKSRYQAWLSLVDILLAYSYEVRFTEGEHNVSVWIYVLIPPEQYLALDDKLRLHIIKNLPFTLPSFHFGRSSKDYQEIPELKVSLCWTAVIAVSVKSQFIVEVTS